MLAQADIPNWVTGAGQLVGIIFVVWLNSKAVEGLQAKYLQDQRDLVTRVENMEKAAQKHVDDNVSRFIDVQKEERAQNLLMFNTVVSLNKDVTKTIEQLAHSLDELSGKQEQLAGAIAEQAKAVTDQAHKQEQLANAITELKGQLGQLKGKQA